MSELIIQVKLVLPEGIHGEVSVLPERHPNVEAAADAGLIDDSDWPFSQDWPEEENAKPAALRCPVCGGPMHLVPGGVSKRTGKKYHAFYGCDDRDCKGKADA